jgi:hypothetical protein
MCYVLCGLPVMNVAMWLWPPQQPKARGSFPLPMSGNNSVGAQGRRECYQSSHWDPLAATLSVSGGWRSAEDLHITPVMESQQSYLSRDRLIEAEACTKVSHKRYRVVLSGYICEQGTKPPQDPASPVLFSSHAAFTRSAFSSLAATDGPARSPLFPPWLRWTHDSLLPRRRLRGHTKPLRRRF